MDGCCISGRWRVVSFGSKRSVAYHDSGSPFGGACGDDTLEAYANSTDASLVTPSVVLGAQPILTFRQWVEMEYDGRYGYEDYYWDGGVVDISTNDGASFERITPVGGYPYKITPNPASPFPDHTPCFGGTGGWELVTFDLEAYAGETVQVRFRFGSDEYTVDRGWFVDDVQFTWGASWLTLTTTSGVVAAGSTSAIPVTLDASGLQPGDYRGAVPLACNDPTRPALTIPIRLHVTSESNDVSIELAEGGSNIFVISWSTTTGRTYNLMRSTNLPDSSGWTGVPDYTNLPGTEGTMSYTGTIDHIPAKFYRITESQP